MNGGRRAVTRGYAPQRRTRGYASTPPRPHGTPPRGLRPRGQAISRNHSDLARPTGIGCRHTQGLEEVWSARHGSSVEADPAFSAAPRIVMTANNDGAAARRERTAPPPEAPEKPDNPTDLTKPAWTFTLKKSINEFLRDQCIDLAAALTYFAVLAIFPAILALVSLLGVFGQGEQTVETVMELAGQFVPQDALAAVQPVIDQMVNTRAAGFALVSGLLVALWSASNYINAFSRAMNRVYDIDEGRPIWKLRPTFMVLTLLLLVLVAIVVAGLVVSGPVAQFVGDLIGLGSFATAVWNYAKWPVILLIVMGIVALLYYVTPNVQQPKFRWISVGAATAIVIWVLASAAFGFYVGNFGNYNATYGALAGVIIALLWLWITNIALLFGAEVDAEMERARQLQGGIKAEQKLQLPPRGTSASEKAAAKRDEFIEEGRRIRLKNQAAGAGSSESEGSRD